MRKYSGSPVNPNGTLKNGLNARLDLGLELTRVASLWALKETKLLDQIQEGLVTTIIVDLWGGDDTPKNRENANRLIRVYLSLAERHLPHGPIGLTEEKVREAYRQYAAGASVYTPPAKKEVPTTTEVDDLAAALVLLKKAGFVISVPEAEAEPELSLNERLAKNRRPRV